MLSLTAFEHLFWSQVQVCEHGRTCDRCCWLWHGRLAHGYGTVTVDGQAMSAHRIAFEVAHGACLLPYPMGCFTHGLRQPLRICVLHRCDTPACVNWHHLFAGTQADNMRDRYAKHGYRKHYKQCALK